ncbi:hypothetical protein AAKU55_005687 [Oxalobacteraceae bacterium GrIS 1.11]
MHPVLTDKGYIPPRDLLVGDMLKTDKGLSRLTSKEVQTFEGEVWGFSLGATPEESN